MSLSVSISNIGQTSFTATVSTTGSVEMEHWWYIDGSKTKEIYTAVGTRSSSYTFSGLSAGTTYTVKVEVYAISPWKHLDTGSTSATTTGGGSSTPDAEYYANLYLDGNGGAMSNGLTIFTKMMCWSGSPEHTTRISDPGFQRSGYSLIGWSESRTASQPSYDPSDTVDIYSTSTSESNPKIMTLYAVWSSNGGGATRPGNWSWTSYVAQGSAFGLTAAEWNGFIDRVEEFAKYKGVTLNSSYLYSAAAAKGGTMLASQANAAQSLVNQLKPPTSVPPAVSLGSPITAAFVNGLKDSLNSIS